MIISNNFENGLLEQITINKYMVGNLNDIDIYENNVTFVQCFRFFNGKITLITKINSYLQGINIKNPNHKM